MNAVRIGPDISMAVVAAPTLFTTRPPPSTPQDLLQHRCINMRLPTRGGLYAWEFERGGKEIRVKVEGPCIVNQVNLLLDAALAGVGIGYLPEDLVAPHLATGRLVRVLEDWCAPFTGYYLYYCGRKHLSAAFSLVVQALRYGNGAQGGPSEPQNHR
jgi:DNA-binding transcriptional LysR family regulator